MKHIYSLAGWLVILGISVVACSDDLRFSRLEQRLQTMDQKLDTLLAMESAPQLKRSQTELVGEKDQILHRLEEIGVSAYQYRIRPTSMGGGGGSYVGWVIPDRLRSDEQAMYSETIQAIYIDVLATSSKGRGTISVRIGPDGNSSTPVFSGTFAGQK